MLLYVLPSTRAHARVQAWRRLQRVGAVLLKNSAYVLPQSPEAREDFEWIRKEIVAADGQAIVLVARAPDQSTFDDLVETFRSARARDFERLAAEAGRLLERATKKRADRGRRELTQSGRRLRERFEDAVRLDFFSTPARVEAATMLARLDQHIGRKPAMIAPAASVDRVHYSGRIWLTRPRPGVDRMSSAWLIRRFIDSNARFVFGEPERQPDAIPFDTFRAEFGHHGSHCTFETLCERFGLADPAVQHIGRIVHDLDLKESTYGEVETATLGRLIDGLRRAHPDDEALLRAGIELFEALYQSMAADAVQAAPVRKRRTKRRNGTRAAGRTRRS
jgi:hypothetical protein